MGKRESDRYLFLAVLFWGMAGRLWGQIGVEDYRRAERLLPWNLEELVFDADVEPNWIGPGARFWYRNHSRRGKEFLLVDAAQDRFGPAFDHSRLAEGLSRATGASHTPYALPFDRFEWAENEEAIRFQLDGAEWECQLATGACRRLEEGEPGEVSPDGRWRAFVRDWNLWVQSRDTGEEIPLTQDGEERFSYGTRLPSPREKIEKGEGWPGDLDVVWSPDSRRLAAYRLDQRSAGHFALVQSVPTDRLRPRHYIYAYPLPGEVGLPVVEPWVFEIETRRKTKIRTPPVPLLYYGGMGLNWFQDSRRLYFTRTERGYRAIQLLEADAGTGATRVMVEERLLPRVDPHMFHFRLVGEGEEILCSSERDGWHHLYLYDGRSGSLKNRVTAGEWVVREIVHLDQEARQVYFTAGGREGGDPYLRYLYRVDLDGSNLHLLTPEEADHAVSVAPDGSCFVDVYSRVDLPTVSLLRRSSDGRVLRELQKADVERLLETGHPWPEPFAGKGRDGQTDIYGLLWRPSTLDPGRKYPVIEYIYTGPHNFHVPKTLLGALRSPAQSLAELGFIAVMVDGMGTGRRSKAFRDVSYQHLGDGGLEDHIALIRQMAARYPYMDLERVGVFGHSAGGYDSAHALLAHPEFYKVAVSSAGNHDHRLDKAWWVELWMGYPVEKHYEEQSNATLAPRLQGKLFLVHGEVDENVHPASTLRLVDALVKANKDFDLLLLPNRFHDLREDPYFIRRRWDYFVRHLAGVEPPPYEIRRKMP